jgi:hypothetical protein
VSDRETGGVVDGVLDALGVGPFADGRIGGVASSGRTLDTAADRATVRRTWATARARAAVDAVAERFGVETPERLAPSLDPAEAREGIGAARFLVRDMDRTGERTRAALAEAGAESDRAVAEERVENVGRLLDAAAGDEVDHRAVADALAHAGMVGDEQVAARVAEQRRLGEAGVERVPELDRPDRFEPAGSLTDRIAAERGGSTALDNDAGYEPSSRS